MSLISAKMVNETARAPAAAESDGLVERLRRGEPAALEELIKLHQRRIRRLISRLLGWSDDVDDVMQEVWIKVVLNVSRFRGDSGLETWLTRIAVNTCRSQQRRQRTLSYHLPFWHRSRSEPKSSASDETAQKIETAEQVRQTVRRLSPKYREVVVLRYLEELSINDIATMLNLKTNTVNVRLSRARSQLEPLLKHLHSAL